MELDSKIKIALEADHYAYDETYSKRRIILLNSENCLVLPPEEYFNYSLNNEDNDIVHYYIDDEIVKKNNIYQVYRYNNLVNLKTRIGNNLVEFCLTDGGKEKITCKERILIYDFKNISNPFMKNGSSFFKDTHDYNEQLDETSFRFIYDNVHDWCVSVDRASYDETIVPIQHHIMNGICTFPNTGDFTLEDAQFSCSENENSMAVSAIGITNFLKAIDGYVSSKKTENGLILKK